MQRRAARGAGMAFWLNKIINKVSVNLQPAFSINSLLLCLIVFGPGISDAADTTITIKGNVKASPCVAETTKTVDFGTIYFADLGAGDYTSTQTISIALTSCPSSTSSVTATFAGTPDTGNYEAWNYKNAGTATGYFISVAQENDSSKGLGNGQTWTQTISSSTNSVVYDISVKIGRSAVAGGATATTGTISGVISVTYTYS